MLNCVFRLLWIIISLAALCLFIVMLADNFKKLTVEFPVSIDITDDYTVPLKFPAVTICNDNPYRYEKPGLAQN